MSIITIIIIIKRRKIFNMHNYTDSDALKFGAEYF